MSVERLKRIDNEVARLSMNVLVPAEIRALVADLVAEVKELRGDVVLLQRGRDGEVDEAHR